MRGGGTGVDLAGEVLPRATPSRYRGARGWGAWHAAAWIPLTLGALMLGAAACRDNGRAASVHASPATVRVPAQMSTASRLPVPRLWRMGDTEDASLVYLVFQPNGALDVVSATGAVQYHWRYDSVAHELSIIPTPPRSMREAAAIREAIADDIARGDLKRYDLSRSELVNAYTPDSARITIEGFNYFACTAANRARGIVDCSDSVTVFKSGR